MGKGTVEEEGRIVISSRQPPYLALGRPSSAPQTLPPSPSLLLLLITKGTNHPSLTPSLPPSLPPSFQGRRGGGGGAGEGARAIWGVAPAGRAAAGEAISLLEDSPSGSDLDEEGGRERGREGRREEGEEGRTG